MVYLDTLFASEIFVRLGYTSERCEGRQEGGETSHFDSPTSPGSLVHFRRAAAPVGRNMRTPIDDKLLHCTN